MSRAKRALPEPLSRVVDLFAAWRATRRTKQQRIPESLWARAVELAASYGVSRTSHALGLRYYGLKARMEGPVRGEGGRPAFVEIVPASRHAATRIRIELENAGGAKMRILASEPGALDLPALARAFLAEGR